MDYNQVKQAMINGFEKALKIEFKKSSLTKTETNLAKKLAINKYSTKDWNFSR